jgi:hypothetical protein
MSSRRARVAASFVSLHAVLLAAAGACAAPVSLDQAPPPPKLELPSELTPSPARSPVPSPQLPARPSPPAALPQAQAPQAQVFDPASERLPSLTPGRAPNAKPTPLPAPVVQSHDGADVAPELREAAKAARQWVDESVPWAQQRGQGDDPSQARSRQDDSADPEHAVPGAIGDKPRAGSASVEVYLLGEMLKFVKDVAGHPMTWLVVALIVIGTAGVSMAKRRAR